MKLGSYVLAALAAAALIGAAAAPASVPAGAMGPMEAIFQAGDAAPHPVYGEFFFTVRAAGMQKDILFLNSEKDYRDQGNLSVVVAPGAIRQLAMRYGREPARYLIGKTILIKGAARRVRIDILDGGHVTGKFTYQTQVAVLDPEQLSVLGPS